MAKKEDKKLIAALNRELKHYVLYDKAERAEEVKKQIKALGGKVESASVKPVQENKKQKPAEKKDKQVNRVGS